MGTLRMHLPLHFGRHRVAVASAAVMLLLAIVPGAYTDEPPVFAVSNARIVPVASPPIEKGTVIIRNGIIEAVGSNLTIPGDARVIDGSGLTVYPGLIDALSDVGLEESRQQASPAAQTARVPGAPPTTPSQQQSSQSPDERQGLTPYRQAADFINPSNRKIESARSAGITTALIAPRSGIFTGQSTLLNLSGGDIGQMVVKTPVAFHISMVRSGGFGGGYPSSLMGIISFVKQTLLDAGHYGVAWGIYGANPGTVRPDYSRALDALQPLVQKKSRVVLSADNAIDIQRVLDLTDSFKLDLMLSGVAEAEKMASVLKDRKIPVLLSVKYPEKDRDADPEAKEELNDLRRRVDAPANAVALAKAGVQFAFQSGDTANPRDFIRNVAKAVEAGLDGQTALRALTITPAEFFGVSDRLGSIEKNKTANLIVTTGDIFDENTKVKMVFIDGRRFEITEQVEPARNPAMGGAGGASAPETASAAGSWTITVNTPQGAIPVTLNLQQAGSVVSGTTSSHMGEATIEEGSFSGGKLTLRINAGGMSVTITGTIQGNSITGSLNAGQMGTMDFTGSRSPRESSDGKEGQHEIN